jgi:hypothetical protein
LLPVLHECWKFVLYNDCAACDRECFIKDGTTLGTATCQKTIGTTGNNNNYPPFKPLWVIHYILQAASANGKEL